MKRIGNLYNKIVDIDNIKLAHKIGLSNKVININKRNVNVHK